MGQTSALRSELKRVFEPLAIQWGFAIDRKNQPNSTEFRRLAGKVVHIFTIQWDKYGTPRFVVHFGTCPSHGLEVNGEILSPQSVLPTWLPDAGTLCPKRGMSTRCWFRQDPSFVGRLLGKQLREPSEVVAELTSLFAEVEQYWASGAPGPHLYKWRR